MSKQEFLRELREALQGEVSQAAVNEHLRYYDSYITEESRKGKGEEEVVDALGSPRLIAKTLIDTSDQFGTYGGAGDYQGDGAGSGGRPGGDGYPGREPGGFRRFAGTWYGKLAIVLVAIFFVLVLSNVVAFFLPVLGPIVLIMVVYALFFGNRR